MLLGADQTMARRYNRAQVLNRLRIQGSASRADLAKQTGLTRSTISRIVDELSQEKLVHEIAEAQNKRGRPGTLLALNPSGGSAIGIEIGVHFISIMLTDFISTPIWQERLEIDDLTDWERYLSGAEMLIDQAIAIAEQNQLPLKGIGVAVWGMVNQFTHLIHFAPNLKWRDVPLETKWRQLYQVPVFVENDANASALGEYYFGAGKDIDDFIYISVDIGVGSGIISKGRLYRGATGYAGEIGHVTIDPNGDLCSCGKRGCLETKVGRNVIVENYKSLAHVENITLEQIIQRGQAGDPLAKKIFEDTGEIIGSGIGFAVNMLNPKAIIIGWSLNQAFNLIIPGVRRSMTKSCLPDLCQDLIITSSMNGLDDALFGCIALVLDEIIRESI